MYRKQVKYLVLIIMLTLGHLVQAKEHLRSMQYTSRSKEQAQAWQKELRARLLHLLKLEDLVSRKTPIPFREKVLSEEKKPKYIKREIEINTTAARRMKVVFALPTAFTGPRPAVVCIHGHDTENYTKANRHNVYYPKTEYYQAFAAVLAERGYVTISADVGQHEVYEKGRTLMGERIWDLMRCVDYLETLPQVDKTRIGCAGLSLGGEMAMWLGAMDERMAATLSSGFLTVMDQMERNHCMCWKFDGLRELVDFADIYSLIAPRYLICQNGLKERPHAFIVPLAHKAMAEIKVIYNDFGVPDNATLFVYDGGHGLQMPNLLSFIEKHLGDKQER